jgi:hypothetical protein
MNAKTVIDTKLQKGEVDTIRAMIMYMLTETEDTEDKFVDKLFALEEKFDKLALKFN